jgi:hypothetical protein
LKLIPKKRIMLRGMKDKSMQPAVKENMLKNSFRLSRRSVDKLMAQTMGKRIDSCYGISYKNLLSARGKHDRFVRGINSYKGPVAHSRKQHSQSFSGKENSRNISNREQPPTRPNRSASRHKNSP